MLEKRCRRTLLATVVFLLAFAFVEARGLAQADRLGRLKEEASQEGDARAKPTQEMVDQIFSFD